MHNGHFYTVLLTAAIISLAAVSCTTSAPSPERGRPFEKMRADDLDRDYISPERIVWTRGDVSDADVLLPLSEGQADLSGRPMCRLVTGAADTASIILDYGKELTGGLRLVLGFDRGKELKVRVRFGESVSETCSELAAPSGSNVLATNDHAIRDEIVLVPKMGSIELGNTGFRFVRIDLLDKDSMMEIQEATAVLRWRDIPRQGSFRCSDDRLNEIWETAAWTVHLNMQEYIWDGVKRDRLIWLGDLHPEMMTVAALFGYNDIIDRSIDLACEQYPLPKWLNSMSSYSLWYLVIQHDWYMQCGGRGFLEKHRGYITGLVDLIDGLVAEDGTETLADKRFLDWPSSPNTSGVEAGYRALLGIALEDAAELCEVLGDRAHADLSRSIKARLEKKVLPHNGLKQAAALMALADIIPAEQACDELIAVGGAEGFSTFYGYYMLEALAKAGRHQDAIDIMRTFWGGMLDLGATSFWEDFNIAWMDNAARIDEMVPEGKVDVHATYGDYCYKSFRHSFCHGWASGPLPWMMHNILGVKVLEPGCAKVCVTPHLGDLEWAEGTYPTPHGVISIRHEKCPDGSVKSTIRAPKGVKIVRNK